MTESELRAALAASQNKILSRIYTNISTDSFNTSLQLEDISNENLKDFWVYTSGFLGVQNFEAIVDSLSEQQIADILSGKFVLKDLSKQELHDTLETAKKLSILKGGMPKTIDLYTIQDGTYKIEKTSKESGNQSPASLTLKTRELYYMSDKQDLNIPPSQIFHIVRNVLVHSTPYINGSKLYLFTGNNNDDSIEITKMWLRGYAELFAQTDKTLDEYMIQDRIVDIMEQQNNFLNNHKDVNQLLSELKNNFSPNIQKNFFRVNNFVKQRLECYDDYFLKNLQSKVKILSLIIAKNPNFLTGPTETINPSILYNLQQVVSQELNTRSVTAFDDADDPLYQKLLETYAKYEKAVDDYNNFKYSRSYNKRSILATKDKAVMILRQQVRVQIERLKHRMTLESAHMNLYDSAGLEYLPVEVAINTVCLMGYNNLVTSAFYEDLLAKTDYQNMNRSQDKFFSDFDLSAISYTYRGKKIRDITDPERVAFVINCIRNSLVHGTMYYSLPSKKQDVDLSFKDALLSFYDEHADTTVTARVDDFYKLFSDDGFTKPRNKNIITGPIIEFPDQENPKQEPILADENQFENE